MAIAWGDYAVGTSGRKFRIGIEFVLTAETSTKITVRPDVYFTGTYGVNDSSNTLARSGSWSVSGAVSIVAAYNSTVLIWSGAPLDITKGAGGTRSLSVSLYGIDVYGTGTTATVSDFFPVPGAATSLSVTRGTGDTQHLCAWSPASGSSAQRLQRRELASGSWGAWATIQPLGGAVASATDNATAANRAYEFRIESVFRFGSAQSSAVSIQTTPAAPSNVQATKSGSNVIVTFTENHSPGMSVQYEVYDKPNGGSRVLIDTIDAGLGTFTHTSPNPAQTHQYEVRAKSAIGATTYSTYAASQVVQLQAPPNAPGNLTASPPVLPANEMVQLAYTHNPVDSSAQTKRQYRHRLVGAGSWTELGQTSTTAQYADITPSVWGYSNGQSFEWSVRTWGAHADPSPWSATSVVALSSRPTCTINEPSGTVTSSSLTIEWGYYDAEGTPQAEWEARLKDGGGTVVQSTGEASAETTATFEKPIADGVSYTVEARVKDGAGLWSEWATFTFPVAYLPSEIVNVAAAYHADSGVMQLTLTPEGAVEGVTAPAVSAIVERRINAGQWEAISGPVDPSTTLIDTECAVSGVNEYRVVALSEIPSASTSDSVTVTTTETRWVFVCAGQGFATIVKVRATVDRVSDRSSVVHRFEGRPDGVLFDGVHTFDEYQVSGIIDAAASPVDDFHALQNLPGVKLLKGPLGVHMYGRMSGTRTPLSGPDLTPVSFRFEKTARSV